MSEPTTPENPHQSQQDELEWRYTPPPTVYDLIRDNIVVRALRLVAHLLARTSMCCYHQLRVIGGKNFLKSRPCIITPNHSSHLDAIAVFASLPIWHVNETWSVAAKDYFFENPNMAMIARLVANCIPVDRIGDSRRGLMLCARKLKEGRNLVIFPEGTRSTTGQIGTFQPGAVMLSRGLKVPIVPAYIKGTRESLAKSRYFPRGERITVVFGRAVRFWEGNLANLDHASAARYLEDRVRVLQREHENPEQKT